MRENSEVVMKFTKLFGFFGKNGSKPISLVAEMKIQLIWGSTRVWTGLDPSILTGMFPIYGSLCPTNGCAQKRHSPKNPMVYPLVFSDRDGQ